MTGNDPLPRKREDAPDAAAAAEDDDDGAHVARIVHLKKVAVNTDEEHEDALLDL